MITVLRRIQQTEKAKIKIPKGVQEAIPVKTIYEDGFFKLPNGKYSASFQFTDINYNDASPSDKDAMFFQYCDLINSLDAGCVAKITINNRRLNNEEFKKTLYSLKQDNLDVLREESNQIMLDHIKLGNGIVQDKYLTITTSQKNIKEARSYFNRISTELSANFARLGSVATSLNGMDRLRILHDFYRNGEETYFNFDIKKSARVGHDFKDYISPDSLEFNKDYFKMGDKFGRVLFLRDYANYLNDDFIASLCDFSHDMVLSLDLIPVPMDEAVKEIETRLLGVETNITTWQRKQNSNNNFSAVVPYDLELQRAESKEFLNDLTTRDQRMLFGTLSLVHLSDSLSQLNSDSQSLMAIARKKFCQLTTLTFQQYDGLCTALPIGVERLQTFRTLTTESAAVFIPFRTQEVTHSAGVPYGINSISKNLIRVDRNQLMNGNSFILGVSGSGKSMTSKYEILQQYLTDESAEIIIIDPEREYNLVRELGGEVIQISSTSPHHINAMDINDYYADGANPVKLKSEFILSLCEQLIGSKNLGAKQKSIIDRCTAKVYRKCGVGNKKKVPTLKDFYEMLLIQEEPEAKDIALEIELFVNGSLDTFAQETNVNIHNRLVCYDTLELGQQLQTVGMLVVLDNILNRITRNRNRGINTYIFIDEIYLLFLQEYSANFLFKLWKRVRKYGAFCIGITQNVEDLLQSHVARTMLANSELVIMLKQAATDSTELAKLMNISETQLNYISNTGVGKGLIKVGNALLPFENKIPKNTTLYNILTTKLNKMEIYVM